MLHAAFRADNGITLPDRFFQEPSMSLQHQPTKQARLWECLSVAAESECSWKSTLLEVLEFVPGMAAPGSAKFIIHQALESWIP